MVACKGMIKKRSMIRTKYTVVLICLSKNADSPFTCVNSYRDFQIKLASVLSNETDE